MEGTDKVYFAYNPHGDVVQLLNERGKLTKNYTYDAFGNEVKPEKKDDNPYRYRGEYYDKETDTLYLRVRYYDAGVGRFLTEDSYTGEDDDPLSLNLYAYCNNTPVNMTDTCGHWGRDKRYKDTSIESYVHMSLTREAINGAKFALMPKNEHSSMIVGLERYYTKILLLGSVLPDYNGNKKKKEKVLNKVLKLKNFSCFAFKVGEKTRHKFDDALHGKSKKGREKLKKYALKEWKKIHYNENNRILILGVALHSIQDYKAHSYKVQLCKIRSGEDSYKKYDLETQVYHLDWVYYYKNKGKVSKEIRKRNRDKFHANTKDNPYAYVKESKNTMNGKKVYIWTTKHNKMDNPRYKAAYSDSVDFLNKIKKFGS